jgi:hypothetical protein
MNKLHSVEEKEKQVTHKISHPAVGEIYCLNEPEARATLYEICVDKRYFQKGASILPGCVWARE